MHHTLRNLTWGLALTAVSLSQAQTLTTGQKLDDFNQLVSAMRAKYGPLEYKKQTQNIDLDVLYPRYVQEITGTQTNGDFYYTINRFIAEFHDGHFGAAVPSTHVKFLGVQTDLVQGKVLIDTINRNLHSEGAFPFNKGDEIISVDGVPVATAVAQLQKYFGSGFEQTERRRAAMSLFNRAATRTPVPKGKSVAIEVKKFGATNIDRINIDWLERGEALDEATSAQTFGLLDGPRAMRRSGRESLANYQMLSIRDSISDLLAGGQSEMSYWCSGNTRIKVPDGATMIMSTPFVAYYWPTEKGNLGYLRIPHYSPRNEITGADEYDMRFQQYEYAVSELERHTVGLVIDQDHNCGGSVEYLERVVGLFMNQDYMPMTFRFMAQKGDVLEWQSWLGETFPNTLDHYLLENVLKTIKAAWQKGERMTEKTSFNALTALKPNARAQYTKPIVMLIDENSGSGGDAFPSMLKGYGRAKLLGTRTMGLGGHVTEQPALENSGISYRITRSLFYRPDGVAVENNGAVPDYPYEITTEDFVGGYLKYREFYTKTLLEEIAKTATN